MQRSKTSSKSKQGPRTRGAQAVKWKRVVPGEDQLHGVEGGVPGVLVDEVIKGRVAPRSPCAQLPS